LLGATISSAVWGVRRYFSPEPTIPPSLRTDLQYTEVQANDLRISQQDNEVLFTRRLSGCIAIAIGQHFDESTGTFKERRLAHILGGDFYHNPLLTKMLFENLHKNASIAIITDTCYAPHGMFEEVILQKLNQYLEENKIKINPRKIKLEHTFYGSQLTGNHEPGSIQLFPNGMLAPRRLTESMLKIYFAPAIDAILR